MVVRLIAEIVLRVVLSHSVFERDGSATKQLKGSSEQSHFIFEINVGKSRIRHRTTIKLNDESIYYRLTLKSN